MKTKTLASPLLFALIISTICTQFAHAAKLPVDRTSKMVHLDKEFGLADGPAWDGRGSLYVPDVKESKLYRYFPKNGKWQVVLPEAGKISASYYSHGRLFLSDNAAGCISALDGKKKIQITTPEDVKKQTRRPNDLVVDPHGGIYFTLTRQNQVMYVSPDGKESVAVEGIDTPNGITLSPDAKTLYVASYAPKKIWSYQIEKAGKPTNGKVFAIMDDGPDKGADGMCMDRQGNVYCAGAADIWIWNPEGKLLEKLHTPTRPINCAFGDNDMRTLYITCLKSGMYSQKMNAYGCDPQKPSEEKYQPAYKSPSTVIPNSIDAHLSVPYAQYGTRKVLADIFVPKGKGKTLPTLVVVHGGGWIKGDKNKFRALAIELAKRGYVTAAIEYRLGYEEPFPAAIHDCHAAVRFLKDNAKQYSVDVNRVGAIGGSAGGHLVGLMAATWHRSEYQGNGGHSEQSAEIHSAIVMAGPMDIVTGTVAEKTKKANVTSNAQIFFGGGLDTHLKNHEMGDVFLQLSKKTCPIFFMMGELDNPTRNAKTRRKLKDLGIETGFKAYKKGKHGCWNQLPWFNDMAKYMDKHFENHFKE